jgi:hypothetical protein
MTSDIAIQESLFSQKEKERQHKAHIEFVAFLAILLRGFGQSEEERKNLEKFATTDEITEDKITNHPIFRLAHPDYKSSPSETSGNRSDHFNNAANGTLAAKPNIFQNPDYAETAMRAALSLSIERYTEDSMARGVKYKMGQKDGNAIDCSGFVAQAVQAMQRASGMAEGNVRAIFTTHSNDQVINLARETGFLLQGQDVNMQNLKAGMIIGIDSGDRKWDRGRTNGIDHIGIVYMDKDTGKLMFSESKGGVGVTTTELSQYLEQAEKKNWKLFAAITKPTSNGCNLTFACRYEWV